MFYVQKITTLNTTSSPATDASTLPVQATAPVASIGDVSHESVVVNWTAEDSGDTVVQKYVILDNESVNGEVAWRRIFRFLWFSKRSSHRMCTNQNILILMGCSSSPVSCGSCRFYHRSHGTRHEPCPQRPPRWETRWCRA